MDIKDIQEKERKLLEVQSVLKSEFIGIDSVIDGIISNVRVWYLFPKMISKPLVINLWGLTGCGKTSLVYRLCELLDINGKTITYNLAKLDEDNSSELEDNITDNISNKERNPVFIFDEFQFAATKSEDGKEKDNKTALKTIWEIIDSGIFKSKIDRYVMNHFMTILYLTSYMEKSGVNIVNGKLTSIDKVVGNQIMVTDSKGEGTSIDDLTKSNNADMQLLVDRYFNYEGKKYSDDGEDNSWCDVIDRYVRNDETYWASAKTIATLLTIYKLTIDDTVQLIQFKKMLQDMDIEQFLLLMYKLETKSKAGFCHDYSGSLVFVIGNVDEAYTVSYNVNPDMDADQFHELTSKLSMVDIKEALQERFRNEQIARLGNIMFMYPSFSSDNFTNIIKLRLSQYKKRVYDNFGVNIEFDKSIVDIIYKDGVFPTQGTRPVFSSVYEIVETKLPHIMLTAYDSGNYEIEKVLLSYDDNKVIADIKYKGDKEMRKEFNQELKIEDLRKNKRDEQQALTAVHESMHFVMYAKLFGKMPEKLVSNCVSGGANGFMMPSCDDKDFSSKGDYLAHIQVCLAGYVAERTVFGNNEMSSGASMDLIAATTTASNMVRDFGMYTENLSPCVYTYLTDPNSSRGGGIINDEECNSRANATIASILNECEKEVENTLNDKEWRAMFSESAQYLFDNVSMPKEKMREIYERVSEKKRKKCLRNESFYRDRLARFCKNG